MAFIDFITCAPATNECVECRIYCMRNIQWPLYCVVVDGGFCDAISLFHWPLLLFSNNFNNDANRIPCCSFNDKSKPIAGAYLNSSESPLHSSECLEQLLNWKYSTPTTGLAGCSMSIVCLDNDYYCLQMGKRKFIAFKTPTRTELHHHFKWSFSLQIACIRNKSAPFCNQFRAGKHSQIWWQNMLLIELN